MPSASAGMPAASWLVPVATWSAPAADGRRHRSRAPSAPAADCGDPRLEGRKPRRELGGAVVERVRARLQVRGPGRERRRSPAASCDGARPRRRPRTPASGPPCAARSSSAAQMAGVPPMRGAVARERRDAVGVVRHAARQLARARGEVGGAGRGLVGAVRQVAWPRSRGPAAPAFERLRPGPRGPFVWVAIVVEARRRATLAPAATPAAPVATPSAPAASASACAGRSLVCVASVAEPVRRAARRRRRACPPRPPPPCVPVASVAGARRPACRTRRRAGACRPRGRRPARCRAGLVDELLEPGDQLAGDDLRARRAVREVRDVESATEPASSAAAASESWAEVTARSTSPT